MMNRDGKIVWQDALAITALLLLLLAVLTGCDDNNDGDGGSPPPVHRANMMDAADVQIGPVIGRRNYSIGLPLNPTPVAEGGWQFPLGPDYEPHYVTARLGSLEGKSRISMRFAVDLADGAVIHGAKCSEQSRGTVELYFQRRGDDWATDGWRWWASFAPIPLSEGEFTISASLTSNWTSVQNKSAASDPDDFRASVRDADRVGFTFGNCTGRGHGIRATGPGTFRLLEFKVE